MNYKSLNISGVLLDRNQLLDYMKSLAIEHNIKISSDKNTYPIYSLDDDYNFIFETYKILNEHIKLGIKIHSAGEWILDNFYIVEEVSKTLKKELTLKKYSKMIGLSSGKYAGFSRAYVLAQEIVSYSDCKIDSDLIYSCLEAYQKNKMLTINEIENFGIFLKISIIKHIREICEKIYSSQLQRLKVESIIERCIENKQPEERRFVNKFNAYNNFEKEIKYSFIEYMSYRLKKFGSKAIKYQEVLENEVSKLGNNVNEIVQKEHVYIANLKSSIGNCIKSLKDVGRINFNELLSDINGIEKILSKDPAGVYIFMDQESKNCYKDKISKISKRTKISEIYIAEKIIELCLKNNKLEKKSHVGYYIIDEGYQELIAILTGQKIEKIKIEKKSKIYISTVFAVSLYITFVLAIIFCLNCKKIFFNTFLIIAIWVPVTEIFIRILNYILSKSKKPTFIPKMNYENNIPDDKKTIVVIPTILKNEKKVKDMIKKLEVYYLANKQDNLYFALLGDVSEENVKETIFDKDIIKSGIEEISRLNEKYKSNGFDRFHFLYRKRVWNEGEGKFIGWERKRGLLVTFNKYIKDLIPNDFAVNTIESQKDLLPTFKYIITLDSDTNLVFNSAAKLIGAMAHVLNKPIIEDGKVVSGYGIMQPRIGLDLNLVESNCFIKLYASQGGIDFYTNAISDIYQDYFKEGIFTGKGIYDIDVYNTILENEIPENIVLSHDLLEGNFLRCALLTDCMLLDGYPEKYLSYISRNHRWVRGDWQIIRWLKSNRLNRISKFKIFDNLRRSLLKIFALVGFLLAFFISFSDLKFSLYILSFFTISISIMYILDIVNYVIFKESNIYGAVYSKKKFAKELSGIPLDFVKIFLDIIFLPYEAWENLDAMFRSFYRMTRKRKLLEWTTSEERR